MKPANRSTYSTLKRASARCVDCSWTTSSRGSLGFGARHSDTTGHTVHCEQTIHVIYKRKDDLR